MDLNLPPMRDVRFQVAGKTVVGLRQAGPALRATDTSRAAPLRRGALVAEGLWQGGRASGSTRALGRGTRKLPGSSFFLVPVKKK